jgi:Stress responsive A/B Barrel Domain
VIRHIVLIQLNDTATPEAVEGIHDALTALVAPGRTSFTMGADLGLRPGNMDVAIVADFEDAEAFGAYDRDAAHDQIRRKMIAPVSSRLERCQFQI